MNISWFYLFKCIRIILLNNENDLYTRTFTHDVKDTKKKHRIVENNKNRSVMNPSIRYFYVIYGILRVRL